MVGHSGVVVGCGGVDVDVHGPVGGHVQCQVLGNKVVVGGVVEYVDVVIEGHVTDNDA